MPFTTVHDNTSFSSISMWAEGVSEDSKQFPTDFSNLLDIACSYILSDIINIPGFVHYKVAEKRDAGLHFLSNWGLDIDVFNVVHENEFNFKKRLEDIGMRIFSMVDINFEGTILYLSKKRIIEDSERSHAEDIHGLLFHPSRQQKIESIKKEPFGDQNRKFGAAGYMLAVTQGLIDFFDKNKDSWTLGWTQRLLDFQMLEKNHSFADKIESAYTANCKRQKNLKDSQLYRRHSMNEQFSQLLSMDADTINTSIELPPLQKHLVMKSKGDLISFWEEVVRLREKNKILRKKLSLAKESYQKNDDASEWYKLIKDIREYSNNLLNSKDKNVIKGASLNAIGVPTVQFSIENAHRKWRAKGYTKEFSLISEVIKTSLNPIKDESVFATFLRYGRRKR